MEEEKQNSKLLSEIIQTIEYGLDQITQDIFEGKKEKLLAYLDVASRFIIFSKERRLLNTTQNMMVIFVRTPNASQVKCIEPDLEPHENHIHLVAPNKITPICTRTDQKPFKPTVRVSKKVEENTTREIETAKRMDVEGKLPYPVAEDKNLQLGFPSNRVCQVICGAPFNG